VTEDEVWNGILNVRRGSEEEKRIEVLHGLIQSAGVREKEIGEGGREGED
jgi:hypothetical protein